MKTRFAAFGLLLALATSAPAADPGWWADRGVKNGAPASNLSPATIGQAKHMAAMALEELELRGRFPAGELTALESAVAAVVDLEPPTFPPGFNPVAPPPGYIGPNNHVLLVGELKALAQPFYDHLRAWNAAWLDNEMIEANIRVVEPGSNPPAYSPYPWSAATSDDANKAIASLGQLKAVFSLRLETVPAYDTDGDGMPDAWETEHGFDPAADDAAGDVDMDGLTNLQEFLAATDPLDPDTDGDLLPDGWEITYGFDPLVMDLDALTADPDGDGFSNFLESVHGTNPFDANSVPPGTPDVEIIYPPDPDDPPDPDEPPAVAGADWHFEVVTSRKHLPKYGFDEFDGFASEPPKRYLHQTETVSFSLHGDEGEAPESEINGNRLSKIDPVTGIRTVEDHQHKGSNGERNDNMGGTVEPESATQAVGVSEVTSYDDEPNAQSDRDATKTLKKRLTEENTTEMLVDNVIAELPDYPTEFTDGSPQAHRNLYDDDLAFDYQRAKYRVVWNDGVAQEDRHPVKWLLIFEPEDDPDTPGNESETNVEVVKVVEWDGEGEESTDYEINPESERPGEDGRYYLVNVEIAPEVLAVNSDFDEGRIDPVSGYAIPDCDDGEIALEAVRNHLDGRFAVNERITEDMYPGFFGVNPSDVGDEFWAGANVTIRKVDKIDPATGHPESGHIRLYGKWGGGPSQYRAIIPYDFDTLAATNLAAGGINKVPGESVYGDTSPFPGGTSYFIEGVHPGKVTLEWRYQKGDVDIVHEQSFEVFTKKAAAQWRLDLDYKIRLETSNDPSGEVRTIEFPLLSDGYRKNTERASEFYDFYRECYHEPLRSHPTGYPNALNWAGLARLAGSQVMGGLSDSEYGIDALENGSYAGLLGPIIVAWPIEQVRQLQVALYVGGWQIFASAGWQHHAFRSSGYEAIEWVAAETEDPDAPLMLSAWRDVRQGVLDHDVGLIESAALEITDREQNHTIVPTWDAIALMSIPLLEEMFSTLGKNSCTPSGLDFSDLFPQLPSPTGSLANTADRWTWIQPGTPGGVLATWNSEPLSRKLALTSQTLKQDAMRFSVFSNLTGSTLPIQSWDDEDVP